MTKYAFQSDRNIQIGVDMRIDNIEHTGPATNPRKKSKRRRNIGRIAVTVRMIVGTTNTDRQIGGVTFTGREGRIGNTATNGDMTKAQKTIGNRRPARRNLRRPDKTGVLSRIRINKRTGTHLRHLETTPA